MKTEKVFFKGHKARQFTDGGTKLIVITDAGPRIAFFGPAEGPNLLFWDSKNLGRGSWKLMGGHRAWTTRPMADECEETYAADNGPVEVVQKGAEWSFTGKDNAVFGIRRGLRIRSLGKGRWSVTSFVKNTSDMLWSGGVWALTCTDPAKGKEYAIPLGDGSSWDAFSVVTAKSWAGHSSLVSDPQLDWHEDVLVVRPAGRECKRMIQAPRGLIGLCDEGRELSFFKRVAYDPAGAYPLRCNIAFYIGPDNFMVEMETMGPELSLRPGEEAVNGETWMLGPYINPGDSRKILRLYGA